MALDALNAAAAAVVLNDADPDTRTQGVVVSALVPGVLGLAVPLVLAQQAGLSGGGSQLGRAAAPAGPQLVAVPDLTGLGADLAMTRLQGDRLVGKRVDVFSAETTSGQVDSQQPHAHAVVRLGSTVTVRVSQGQPPPAPSTVDVDADLTAKINAARDDIEAKMAASQQAVNTKLDAITKAVNALLPAAGSTGSAVANTGGKT